MVLKLFRDLLNVAFKVFNVKNLPQQTELPTTGDPKVSKQDGGGTDDSTWIVVMPTTGHRTAPCLTHCQGSTQTVDTVGLTVLLSLQCRSVFPSSFSTGRSLTSWVWQDKAQLSCVAAEDGPLLPTKPSRSPGQLVSKSLSF